MEKVLRKSLICLGFFIASLSFGQVGDAFGYVNYYDIAPLQDVNVYLHDSTGTVIATDITDAAGYYEFNDVPFGEYTLTFDTDVPAGGVSLQDAFQVLMHILNIDPLTGLHYLAADVNASGQVNFADYFEILFSYLNQGNPFSGGDWIFPELPIQVGGGSREGFTTSSTSVGDVNGTFQPPKYGNCFISNQLPEPLVAEISKIIPLKLENQEEISLTGAHLVFRIPEGITVGNVSSDLTGYQFFQENGTLRVTWMRTNTNPITVAAGSPLFAIEVTSNSSTRTGEELNIVLSPESHLIGADGNMLPFTNFTLPGIKFEEATEIQVKENIYPNPFVSSVTLEYQLPSEGMVKIYIINNAGQVVNAAVEEYQQAGFHQVKIDGTQWPAGTYHYTLQFSKSSFISGSMIKSK